MTESERYNEAWATGNYDPMIGLFYTRCLYRTLYFDEYKKILDVGCGTGAAVKYHREIGGKEAYGIDFAQPATKFWDSFGVKKWCSVASADSIPFKSNSFDMVTCTDMMEHIPEDSVEEVLKEMFRVGRNDFFFTICMIPAKHKMPHDNSEPHICLKEAEWWIEKLGKIGYRYTAWPHTFWQKELFIQARKPHETYKRRYH